MWQWFRALTKPDDTYHKKHLDEVVRMLRSCQKSNNKYILDYNTQALLRYVNTISEEYKK